MPSFDISEYPKLEEWVRGGMKKAALAGAKSAAFRLVSLIQNDLIPGEKYPPVFDNAYRAGWHPEATPTGAEVTNTVPHAAIIEWGARGENIKIGRAMIDALAEWARRKGLAGRQLGLSGKAARAPSGDVLVASRQIAWAIAKAMQGAGQRGSAFDRGIFNRDGQKGLRIAERAAQRAPAILVEEITGELRKALA
jgi:hypothetical protein